VEHGAGMAKNGGEGAEYRGGSHGEGTERGPGVTEIGLSREWLFCRSHSAHMLCETPWSIVNVKKTDRNCTKYTVNEIKLTNMTIVWAEKWTTFKLSLYVDTLKHIERLSGSPRYVTEKPNADFL